MKVGKWFESSRNSIKQSSVRLSFLLVVTCFLVFSASAQVQILKPTASTDAEGSTTSPGNAHDFDYVVNLNTSSTTTQPNADPSITWNSWDTTDKRSYLDLNLTVTVSSSAFSDDTWSIYYDNTTGGCSSASTVIKASGSENIATTNYTVSLPAGQDLSNLDVCIVGSRNKGGDSGNVNIFDIRTEGYYETDPPQWRNQGQDKNVMQSHENNTLFAQASDPGGLNWAMLSTNETGVFQNQSRRTDTAEYNASIGAPECSVVSPEVCVAGSNLLLSKDNIGTPEPNSPNTIDGAVDGTSGTYASDESMENITIEAVDGALIEPGEQVRVTLWVHCFSSDDNINLVYTSDVANPSWIVKDAVGSCSAQGYHRYQFTFNLDNVEGRHAVRGLIQYQGSTSTTAQAGQYDDNDDLVFSVEDKTDAEENSLGSKIFFNGSTAWEWSNFTWSNPGVPLGSLVGWRIWYSDTNGNMNSTDIESFAIAGPASIENLTVYNGSDYSNLENLSAVTRADTAIFRTNVTTTVSGIDSVSIVLRNSTGHVKLSNASMTNISAVSSGGIGGQYEYNYSIPNDADARRFHGLQDATALPKVQPERTRKHHSAPGRGVRAKGYSNGRRKTRTRG